MGETTAPGGAVFVGAARTERDGVLARLETLVACESPSGDVALLDACAASLRDRWEELGLSVTSVPSDGGQHLVASLAPREGAPDGHVLFLAHYDTVWSAGELARQPFAVDQDLVRGPGSFDMKGGIVALELAVALLADAGVRPAREVRLVCIADEEVSSVDGRKVVLEQSEGAVAVIGLEPPHPGGGFKNARRGVARVVLKVTGRAAHAGLNAAVGISAIDELVDQLAALREALPTARDAGFNVGRITGGTRANVVAAEAEAEIGLRFATKETEDALFAALASLSPRRESATLELRVLSHRPAWDPSTNWLSDHMLALAAERGEPTEAGPAGGAGDTNFTGAAGIATLDGLGPRGAHAHAVGEYLELSSILERAELLATFMARPLPV